MPPLTGSVTLWCLREGDPFTNRFRVETDYRHDIHELKSLIISSVLKDKTLVDITLYKVNMTEKEFEDFDFEEVLLDPEDTIREVFPGRHLSSKCVNILIGFCRK